LYKYLISLNKNKEFIKNKAKTGENAQIAPLLFFRSHQLPTVLYSRFQELL